MNGVNTVLWKNKAANRLHTWYLDSNWNYVMARTGLIPSGAALAFETNFNLDLNGDGTIGKNQAFYFSSLGISYKSLPRYGPKRGFNMDVELSPAILKDNKLIVAGRNNSFYANIVEFDLITGLSSEHKLNLPNSAVGDISSIVELANGEYIVSGFTNIPVGPSPSGSDNGYVARIDSE